MIRYFLKVAMKVMKKKKLRVNSKSINYLRKSYKRKNKLRVVQNTLKFS